MRICLNGLPGLISVTVPTGKSRGKIRSIPLVTTRSPRFTESSFGTYFIISKGSPCPPTGLWMRESASVAKPAEAVGTGAFERRNRADGPDAKEPSLRVALDLHCQQDDLQHDDSCEQDQRFVARGNGDHLFRDS